MVGSRGTPRILLLHIWAPVALHITPWSLRLGLRSRTAGARAQPGFLLTKPLLPPLCCRVMRTRSCCASSTTGASSQRSARPCGPSSWATTSSGWRKQKGRRLVTPMGSSVARGARCYEAGELWSHFGSRWGREVQCRGAKKLQSNTCPNASHRCHFFRLTFYFEIIIGSRAVIRTNADGSHVSLSNFPSGNIFQNYNITTRVLPLVQYTTLTPTSQFTCICVWVWVSVCRYLVLHNFITCHSQHTDYFQHSQISSNCPFMATATSLPLPAPSPAPGNHESSLNSYNFLISWMLYKWNRTACSLLRLTFFTQHNCLAIHPSCCLYQ